MTSGYVDRTALSRFASGVTVVTACDDSGRPCGFTATAFSLVSWDPPLVLVCLARGAGCHDTFARADRYAVHVLGSDQAGLARQFGRSGADKFEDVGYHLDGDGLPVLPGVLSRMVCEAHATVPGGDHTILVGRVAATTDPIAGASAAEPLLHFDRRFWTLAGPVPPAATRDGVPVDT